MRYRMLQTLRDFGLECLTRAGEMDVIRQAHALYYLALANMSEPYLKGTERAPWMIRLEQEHENLPQLNADIE